MTHSRENLRLSLHDLQQCATTLVTTNSCSGGSSGVSQSMTVTAAQAINTVANRLNKSVVCQSEKCERLKKMTSITCSDSEDDSERRIQMEAMNKWNSSGYEGDTRTHIVQEIFRNEQSYVESLQTVICKYLKVLKLPEHAGMIEVRTVDEIFFMVPDILEIHEKFLAELRNRLDNWDTQQKVGDAFMETFSKLEVLEVYTSFVNNCNRAKNAIRSTKHQRPSFAKFLEATAREHKGKLTLDNLLIKPL